MEKKEVLKKKKCQACDRVKEITSFTKCPNCRDGFLPRCKICVSNGFYIHKKKVKFTQEEEKLVLNGLTSSDWTEYYKIMYILGFDIFGDIHEQFMNKHNLPISKRRKNFRNIKRPEDLGFIKNQ